MSMDGMPEYTPAKRARHRFAFPESYAKLGVQSVTLVELLASEENMAMKRCADSPLQITSECTKQSIVEVNDQPVSLGNGTTDQFWERAHPSVRLMLTRAYSEVHNPKLKELDDFLKSHATEI